MIGTCLSQLVDPKLFRTAMVKLAVDHIKRGVWAIQYGVVGDILFWTLQKCLGTAFTRDVEVSWKIVFSSVLRIIVPIAVYCEHKKCNTVDTELFPKIQKTVIEPDIFDDEITITQAAMIII